MLVGVLLGALWVYNLPGPTVRFAMQHHMLVAVRGGLRLPMILYRKEQMPSATLVRNMDGEASTGLRLLVNVQFGEHNPSRLLVFDAENPVLPNPILLWSHEYCRSGLPHETAADYPDGQYNPTSICAGDLDGDSKMEFVVGTTVHPHAPTVFHLFDGERSPCGAFEVMGNADPDGVLITDIDMDGRNEFVVLSFANPWDGSSLCSLERSHFFPAATGSPDYGNQTEPRGGWSPATQPCDGAILIPGESRLLRVSHLPRIGAHGLRVNHGEDGHSTAHFLLFARGGPDVTDDYIVDVQFPPRLLAFFTTDWMKEQTDAWLASGVTSIDFYSQQFCHEWAQAFRCGTTIPWDTTWVSQPLVGIENTP